MEKHQMLEIVTQETSEMEVKLLVGPEVINIISDEKFLSEWDLLYQECPWTTPYQSKEFICPWYQIYQDVYLPILVIATENGVLKGLLPVTLPMIDFTVKGRFIRGAGHGEADYQCWICLPSESDNFAQEAFTQILNRFPDNDIMLRRLPPGTPTGFMNKMPWKKKCVMQPTKRPIMAMDEFKTDKRDNKRIRRLQNLGKFKIIKEVSDFESFLQDASVNYDFRQGAMFNRMPFKEDVLFKEFLLALFKNELLHVSALYREKELVSAVATVIGKNRAHLGGINLHSPFYGSYSPGYVHFLMLGQHYIDERFELFDLTPGEDAYKIRLATRFDEANVLIVTNNPVYFYKRKIRKFVHFNLLKFGIVPMQVELNFKRHLDIIKNKGSVAYLKKTTAYAVKPGKLEIIYLNSRFKKPYSLISIKHNSISDLLCYDAEASPYSKWEFLYHAMEKLESGEQFLSYTSNGVLIYLAWINGKKVNLNLKGQKPNGHLIYGLYLHPVGSYKLTNFLCSAVDILKQLPVQDQESSDKTSKKNHPGASVPVYLAARKKIKHTLENRLKGSLNVFFIALIILTIVILCK